VADAAAAYDDDEDAQRILLAHAARLGEPLRVAVAGMVKAGKSTLLNAIIGEEIAPTDTGECTRVVTWYRYGHSPRVTLHPVVGEPRILPIVRLRGRLVFDLGELRADDVRRLVVDWPSAALRSVTLIDTPGIASLSTDVSERTARFLTPESSPSEADAIVYLMRHMHASDIRFLESFRDTTSGTSGTVNALAVLSRADEIGAGRIDSLLSSRDIADRYRHDATLRALCLGIVPVAGLLAQSARTLRQSEFAALRTLAGLGKADRELLLLSADRFTRPDPRPAPDADGPGGGPSGTGVPVETRRELLQRFGLFGIRLAIVLIAAGVDDADDLAHELARRSGLDELMTLVSRQFQARADLLKARTALAAVERLVHERPRANIDGLLASIERLRSNTHDLLELRLLATLRTEPITLTADLVAEGERLLGGQGVAVHERLGLGEDAADSDVRARAVFHLDRWRSLAESPLSDRATTEVCRTIARSCEGVVAQLPIMTTVKPARMRLFLASEPGTRTG
jgi:hypothetical protein